MNHHVDPPGAPGGLRHARSLKTRIQVASLVALAALAALAACGGGGSTPPVPKPQTLALPLTLGINVSGPGHNPGPRIMVALPGGSPMPMLVDTGSTGLRLLPSALEGVPASAYTDTKTAVSAAFGSGKTYYGTLGKTTPGVVIGGPGTTVTVAKPFYFEIVRMVCPTPATTSVTPPAGCVDESATAEAETGGGLIGVRPSVGRGDPDSLSPLAELPAPYSNGFVISAYGASPTLTVGATAENQTGFQTVSVPTVTAYDGSAAWTTQAFPWCYTITNAASSTAQGCPSSPVLTDSGGANETISLAVAPPSPFPAYVKANLDAGSTIVATLTSPGATNPSITWKLTTGTCASFDDPSLYFADPANVPSPAPSSTPGSSNGLEPFFSNDVLYDLRAGAFGFRPAPAALQIAPASCTM